MLGPGKQPKTAAVTAATAPPLPSASTADIRVPVDQTDIIKEPFVIDITSKHSDASIGRHGLSVQRPPHHLPEWIETDSIDYVLRLVDVLSGKYRRCCINSSSSGYSSNTPPLSADSFGAGTKGLAVIREDEIIPRPIWPLSLQSTGENSSDIVSNDNVEHEPNHQQASLYGSAGYHSSCEGSNSNYGGVTSSVSAREVLLELSRTVCSVLEGDCDKTDEEVLRDISRAVAQGVDAKQRSIYDEIYRNSSLSSSGKESTSTIGVNPNNSRLYGHRCYCEKKSFLHQSHPSSSQQMSPKPYGKKKQCSSSVFLLSNVRNKSVFQGSDDSRMSCGCRSYRITNNSITDKLSSNKTLGKQSRNQNDVQGEKDMQFNYPSIVEHEYTTLECSDENSSSEGTADSPMQKSSWCEDFRGFDKNLDFTLDGWRAERLGHVIARAKQRRQCCRILVIIIGLVFFVLSVVVVSLSVTRGRKIFGSM